MEIKKKDKKSQKANKENEQAVQEEKATENRNEIPKEIRERKEKERKEREKEERENEKNKEKNKDKDMASKIFTMINKVNNLSKKEANRNGVWSIVKRCLETSERIAYIKGDIKNEQDKLQHQNSRNAQNRFMQLACLKSDIENIENELKNERFKDSNKLEEYENQINNIVNECKLLGIEKNKNIKEESH